MLQREIVAPNGFAERFDDRLRTWLGRACRLGHGFAPPLQPDARHHRLARDSACAGKLVIEGQQGQEIAPPWLGSEQRAKKAVAVHAAHLVEHVAVRGFRCAIGVGGVHGRR